MDALTCFPSLARAIKSSILTNSAILTPHNVNLIEHRGTKITLVRLNFSVTHAIRMNDSCQCRPGLSTGIGADLSGEFFHEFQDLRLVDRLGQINPRGG